MTLDVKLSTVAETRASNHLCHHTGCGKWGGWGYDAGKGVSEWWCLEHRPDQDPIQPPSMEENWISDGNEG